MVPATKYSGNPVLSHGPEGSPDAQEAAFDGSIIRIGGKYRMWYTARAKPDVEGKPSISQDSKVTSYWPAYAESEDGLHWVKARLGLVDFNGNKNNNRLLFSPPRLNFALMALYGRYYPSTDPEHKDHSRATIYLYFSADGLRWNLAVPAPQSETFTEREDPPRNARVFELAGLYRFDGIYYVPGHEFWMTHRCRMVRRLAE